MVSGVILVQFNPARNKGKLVEVHAVRPRRILTPNGFNEHWIDKREWEANCTIK